jgi:hypothetical protein
MLRKLQKAFLLTVGLISLTFEQIGKAIQEASQSLEEQVPKLSDRLHNQHKQS